MGPPHSFGGAKGAHSDLRSTAYRCHGAPRGQSQQLAAETNTQEGDLAGEAVADEGPHGGEPEDRLVVGTRAATQHDDAVEPLR